MAEDTSKFDTLQAGEKLAKEITLDKDVAVILHGASSFIGIILLSRYFQKVEIVTETVRVALHRILPEKADRVLLQKVLENSAKAGDKLSRTLAGRSKINLRDMVAYAESKRITIDTLLEKPIQPDLVRTVPEHPALQFPHKTTTCPKCGHPHDC